MKKNIKIIIWIGIFLILVAGIIFTPFRDYMTGLKNRADKSLTGFIFQDKVDLEEESNNQVLEESTISVILIIDYGDGISQDFDIEFVEGMTAFDLLNDRAEELSLETKAYDIGILIEAVGDKKNGQDGKYWLYYINGEMPMVSVDNLKINPDDKVEFKFEKSPF